MSQVATPVEAALADLATPGEVLGHANPRPRILLVDDDDIVRTLLSVSLDAGGFEVYEAEDGVRGLDLATSMRPDVVVLDVMMPGLDGFEVCQAIRDRPELAHVPVLMMTGLDDEESIRRAFDVGATDFVSKPINSMLLAHRLSFLLRAERMTDELRSSERRLASAQRIARMAYWEWYRAEDRIYWSAEADWVLHIPEQELPQTLAQLLERIHDEDREALRQAVYEGEHFSTELRFNQGPEQWLNLQLKAEPVATRGVAAFGAAMKDITERKQAEDTIHRLSSFDPLTGLANRSELVRELDRMLIDAHGRCTQVAVVRVDINDFKRVNHSFGMAAGDELLRQLARRLSVPDRESPCPIALLASLGGDEFVAVVTGLSSAEELQPQITSLRGRCALPLRVGESEVVLSSRMGVALYPEDGESAEMLLSHAGVAVNEAKRLAVANEACYYRSDLNALARERMTMETELRLAVELGALELFFQPKVHSETHRPVGAEALVRWRHPTLGNIPPMTFITLAEQTGLIVDIGAWVLEHACRAAVDWSRRWPDPLTIAVNVSVEQMRRCDMPALVERVLAQTGLPPKRLELEITEGIMLGGDGAVEIINRLSALGVRIAIDDFGTGYSSFAYLRRLPIHTLKIDRAFVQSIATDSGDAAIVSAIVSLAHNLGLDVVAEGVEDDDQVTVLQAYRCDVLQGYLFGRPMPAAKWVRWVDEHYAHAAAQQ
jgi:diguanylate cyclase (GGDEF)-like protein